MIATVQQYLAAIASGNDRNALAALFQGVAGMASRTALTSAGLGIKTATSALVKTGGSAFYALVNGRLVTIAANTDMPALTGLNITANRFNVACFFVNQAGTVTVRFGTEAAAIGNVKFPDYPADAAPVGFALITHSSAFTGGTTALDTATTVYFSPTGAYDPSFIFA